MKLIRWARRRPILLIAAVAALPLVFGLAALCQDFVTCHGTSSDGKTPIDVQIMAPLPGTTDTMYAPCPEQVEVKGFASTIGLPVDIEVYFIIDSSGSTAQASGADVDNDSNLGTGNPSSDPDDSILAAEIEAVRQFVSSLDPDVSRAAVIQFSNPEGTIGVGERQRIVQSLTGDFTLIDQALDDVFNAVPNSAGATDYGGALELLVQEFLANHRAGSYAVSLFMSDGVPTWPEFPYNSEEPGDTQAALDGAARARDNGIVVNTFGVGTIFFPPSDTLERVALITGGTYTEILLPSEILTALPATSLVGIRSVEVRNSTLNVSVSPAVGPDGSFTALLPISQGRNDIEVKAVADNGEATELQCFTDYTLQCLKLADCFAVNRMEVDCGATADEDADESADDAFAAPAAPPLGPAPLADEDADCASPVDLELGGSFLFDPWATYSPTDRVLLIVNGVVAVDVPVSDFRKDLKGEVYTATLPAPDQGRVTLDFDRCEYSASIRHAALADLEPGVPVHVELRIGIDTGSDDATLSGKTPNLRFDRLPSVSCCLNAPDEDEDADGPDEDEDADAAAAVHDLARSRMDRSSGR